MSMGEGGLLSRVWDAIFYSAVEQMLSQPWAIPPTDKPVSTFQSSGDPLFAVDQVLRETSSSPNFLNPFNPR